MNSMTEPRLLPANRTARLFRVPLAWLKQEAAAGRIPSLKADTALLFDPDAVEAVLVERARGSGKEGDR